MRRLDARDDAVGLQDGQDRIGDLLTHPILQFGRCAANRTRPANRLRPACAGSGVVHIYESVKGQQVVFAHLARWDSGEPDKVPGLLVAVLRDRIAQPSSSPAKNVQEQINDPIRWSARVGPIWVVAERNQ